MGTFKLVFFPMLISTIIGHLYFKDSINNYLCAKTKGIIIAMLFIVIFFYTYTGIIGKNFAILDINSFFIAIILGQYYSYKNMNNKKICNKTIAIIILGIITLSFVIFSLKPPHIPLFKDPITNSFGVNKK